MTVYAIGDLQGCYVPLRRLLDAIEFDRACDRLLFTGDLVNRGPDSLAVLRFVKELGVQADTVLGNHDLHLLAVAAGVARPRRKDTLDEVLGAPDRDELLHWLRTRPLALHKHGVLLIHAGLAPEWTLDATIGLAAEVEHVLRQPNYAEFLSQMYGDTPARWSNTLSGAQRLRCIVNYLTRARYCLADGSLELKAKGAPGTQPKNLMPWFRIPGRATAENVVVFGHWSTLGPVSDPGILSLDSGCVWGGALTAVQLPNGKLTTIACDSYQAPA